MQSVTLLSSCGHPFLSASSLLLSLQKACVVWKKKSRSGSMLMLFFHFIGFFFKSKWKLLLRRIDCYYLQNGEVPLRPQGVNATKKIAFMSKTNNEWQNPHLKLRSPIRLVISVFSSLISILMLKRRRNFGAKNIMSPISLLFNYLHNYNISLK